MVVEVQATVETTDEIDCKVRRSIVGQIYWIGLTVGGVDLNIELGKAEDVHTALGDAIVEAKRLKDQETKSAAAATAARA